MTQIAGILTFAMIAVGLLTMFNPPAPERDNTESVVVLADD